MDRSPNKITFTYHIQNFGPSAISDSIFEIYIPSNFSGLGNITSSITVSGEYDNRKLEYETPLTNRIFDKNSILNSNFNINRQSLSISNILEEFSNNRTIYFNCTDFSNHTCVKVAFRMSGIETIDTKFVVIRVNITLDFKNMGKSQQY